MQGCFCNAPTPLNCHPAAWQVDAKMVCSQGHIMGFLFWRYLWYNPMGHFARSPRNLYWADIFFNIRPKLRPMHVLVSFLYYKDTGAMFSPPSGYITWSWWRGHFAVVWIESSSCHPCWLGVCWCTSHCKGLLGGYLSISALSYGQCMF